MTQTIERSNRPKFINQDFLHDVLTGLGGEHKKLSCRFFYDERGSRLFDEICELEEYYLTRTELAIMRDFAKDMVQAIGPDIRLVELGSGSSVKSRILLDNLKSPVAYVPVDISREHLRHTVKALAKEYSHLEIQPVCADFCTDFSLPNASRETSRTVVYFPGSTIGNFLPCETKMLLSRIANICGKDGGLLIGVDLKKDISLIERAYNDSQGITAEFNLNLLKRMQQELDAELNVEAYEHLAFYNSHAGRVEIYIRSLEDQTIRVGGDVFSLRAGERIHTENSHKYSVEEFAARAKESGLKLEKSWTDPKNYFAVMYFKVTE